MGTGPHHAPVLAGHACAGIPATLLLVVTGGPRLGENHRRMLCSACSLAPDVDVRPSLADLPGRLTLPSAGASTGRVIAGLVA